MIPPANQTDPIKQARQAIDDYVRIVRKTYGHDDYPAPPDPSQPTHLTSIQHTEPTNDPALQTTVEAIQDMVSELARIAHSQVLYLARTDDAEWIILSIQLAGTISNAQTSAIHAGTTGLAEMRFADQPELRTLEENPSMRELLRAERRRVCLKAAHIAITRTRYLICSDIRQHLAVSQHHHVTNDPQIRRHVDIGRIPIPPRDIEQVFERIEKAIQNASQQLQIHIASSNTDIDNLKAYVPNDMRTPARR